MRVHKQFDAHFNYIINQKYFGKWFTTINVYFIGNKVKKLKERNRNTTSMFFLKTYALKPKV